MSAQPNAQPSDANPDLDKFLDFLPVSFSTAETTISPVARGNSGAGVFLIDSAGSKSILKVTSQDEPVGDWERAVVTQRMAAELGIAPAVLHVEPAHRAVLSAFVADRSFPALYGNPATRENAIAALGEMVRGIHSIAPLSSHPIADPTGMFAKFWAVLQPENSAKRIVPSFAFDAWQQVTHANVAASDRMPVLCHNDMNPTNIVYDGERLLMFDWQTTAINDPYYDLATIAVFLRMDDATSLQLLSAYDQAPVLHIHERFTYFRRVAAALSGSAFLYMARMRGYAEMDTELSIEAAPTLSEIYAALRTGQLNLGLPEAQWRFGLALLKESMRT